MTYAASLTQAVSCLQIGIFIASVTLEKQEQFLIISWYELTAASHTIAYANFFLICINMGFVFGQPFWNVSLYIKIISPNGLLPAWLGKSIYFFFFLMYAQASLKETVEQNKVDLLLMALLDKVFIFCVWFYYILNSDNKVAFPLWGQ